MSLLPTLAPLCLGSYQHSVDLYGVCYIEWGGTDQKTQRKQRTAEWKEGMSDLSRKGQSGSPLRRQPQMVVLQGERGCVSNF